MSGNLSPLVFSEGRLPAIRLRTKTGESPDAVFTERRRYRYPYEMPEELRNNSVRGSPKTKRVWSRYRGRRFRKKRLVWCFLVISLVLLFCAYRRWSRIFKPMLAFWKIEAGKRNRTSGYPSPNVNGGQEHGQEIVRKHLFTGTDAAVSRPSPVSQTTSTLSRTTRKYPIVDRAVLDRLDKVEAFVAQANGYYPYNSDSNVQQASTTSSTRNGPPLLTRILDRPGRARLAKLCESMLHPRPCRFFFPLRISEQESKARIHLSQIIELARRLNRTLVLPNVGKSKLGACFRWPIDTYYDLTSLHSDVGSRDDDEGKDKEWFIELEAFRTWLEYKDRVHNDWSGSGVKSQLVTVVPSLSPRFDQVVF